MKTFVCGEVGGQQVVIDSDHHLDGFWNWAYRIVKEGTLLEVVAAVRACGFAARLEPYEDACIGSTVLNLSDPETGRVLGPRNTLEYDAAQWDPSSGPAPYNLEWTCCWCGQRDVIAGLREAECPYGAVH